MHSCKISRKQVWRVSLSRSSTYLHSLYEKTKTLGSMYLTSVCLHPMLYISQCSFLIAPFALTSTTSSHPNPPRCTMAPTPSTASGKFFKQLLAVCKRAQLILCEVCTMRHLCEYTSSVHICPELSWHFRGKGKTTKMYNKWVIKINEQLLNSKMLTNSAFVHLDVF